MDPKEKGPQPPFPPQTQEFPGDERKMEPRPDYGESSYRGLGRLKDKTALVTGADSGIGRAVALAFAREGADVVIAYLNEHEDANVTRRAVESAGRRALLAAGDPAVRAGDQSPLVLQPAEPAIRRFAVVGARFHFSFLAGKLLRLRREGRLRAFLLWVHRPWTLCRADRTCIPTSREASGPAERGTPERRRQRRTSEREWCRRTRPCRRARRSPSPPRPR